MPTRDRLLAWVVMVVGGAIVMGVPALLAESLSRSVLLVVSVVGGATAFAGALWDDTICRRRRDERVAEIHYRSGYNALLAVTVLLGTLFFTAVNLETAVPPMVVWGVIVAGVVAYFGSVAWYKRVM